jgi:hypothetical protein
MIKSSIIRPDAKSTFTVNVSMIRVAKAETETLNRLDGRSELAGKRAIIVVAVNGTVFTALTEMDPTVDDPDWPLIEARTEVVASIWNHIEGTEMDTPQMPSIEEGWHMADGCTFRILARLADGCKDTVTLHGRVRMLPTKSRT